MPQVCRDCQPQSWNRRCSTSCVPSCDPLNLLGDMLPQAIKLDPTLDEAKITVAMTRLDAIWDQLFPGGADPIVKLLVEKVIVSPNDLEVRLRANGIERLVLELRPRPANQTAEALAWRYPHPENRQAGHPADQRRQANLVRADPDQAPQRSQVGHLAKRRDRAGQTMGRGADIDTTGAGQGHRWLVMLESGEAKSPEGNRHAGRDRQQLRQPDGQPDHAGPDIIAAILDDTLPNHITLFDLAVDPPALWDRAAGESRTLGRWRHHLSSKCPEIAGHQEQVIRIGRAGLNSHVIRTTAALSHRPGMDQQAADAGDVGGLCGTQQRILEQAWPSPFALMPLSTASRARIATGTG